MTDQNISSPIEMLIGENIRKTILICLEKMISYLSGIIQYPPTNLDCILIGLLTTISFYYDMLSSSANKNNVRKALLISLIANELRFNFLDIEDDLEYSRFTMSHSYSEIFKRFETPEMLEESLNLLKKLDEKHESDPSNTN